jgi:hypothetical protein
MTNTNETEGLGIPEGSNKPNIPLFFEFDAKPFVTREEFDKWTDIVMRSLKTNVSIGQSVKRLAEDYRERKSRANTALEFTKTVVLVILFGALVGDVIKAIIAGLS